MKIKWSSTEMNFGFFFGKTLQMFLRFTCLFLSEHNDITNSSKSRKQTKDKLRSEEPSVNTDYWLLCSPSWSVSPWAGSQRPERCWTAAPTTRCWYSLWRTATSVWTRSTCSSVRRSGWVTRRQNALNTLPKPSIERRMCRSRWGVAALMSTPLLIFHD